MNNISSINFKSHQKDVIQIKKSCKYLANNVDKKPISKVAVDVADLGGKVYLSAVNKNNQSKIMLEVKNEQGASAYTCIKNGSLNDIKNYLNSESINKSVNSFIKQLKNFLKEKTDQV